MAEEKEVTTEIDVDLIQHHNVGKTKKPEPEPEDDEGMNPHN